jgi:hypothetical protein
VTDSNKTLIAALLDRSGSMSSCVDATVEGFDELINGQKAEPGDAVVTLAQFDTEYNVVYQNTPIGEVPSLVLIPRGGTALLDGIGKLITDVGAELAALSEDERPGTVIVMIMTDGGENSSHEWKLPAVKALIEKQTGVYGWKFMFLGANIDAVGVAGSMGIGASSAIQYDSFNPGATRGVYASASAAMTSTRSGLVPEAVFSDEDRAKAMGGKKTTRGIVGSSR